MFGPSVACSVLGPVTLDVDAIGAVLCCFIAVSPGDLLLSSIRLQ